MSGRQCALAGIKPMLIWAAVVSASVSGHAEAASLRSDLTITFACLPNQIESKRRALEGFFSSRRIDAVDRAASRRSAGEFVAHRIEFIGVSADDVMVEILSNPIRRDHYIAGIRTRPPTARRDQLEQDLLRLIQDDLACVVQDVDRNTNGLEAGALFESLLKTYRGWISSGKI